MKKKAGHLLVLTLVLLASFLLTGCMLPFMGNEPVVIKSKPVVNAIVGKQYKYNLSVEDDYKTKLVYNLTDAPEGMTIDGSTGLIMWIPTKEQIGSHKVIIRVSDGWYKDQQEFTILVKEYQLESITVDPTKMSFNAVNQTESILTITAKYTDGTSKFIEKEDCLFSSSNPGVATVDVTGRVTSKNFSSTTIVVSYTEEGVTKTANVTVNVKKPTPPGSGST